MSWQLPLYPEGRVVTGCRGPPCAAAHPPLRPIGACQTATCPRNQNLPQPRNVPPDRARVVPTRDAVGAWLQGSHCRTRGARGSTRGAVHDRGDLDPSAATASPLDPLPGPACSRWPCTVGPMLHRHTGVADWGGTNAPAGHLRSQRGRVRFVRGPERGRRFSPLRARRRGRGQALRRAGQRVKG